LIRSFIIIFVTPGFPYYDTRAKSGPCSHFPSREDILSLMKNNIFAKNLLIWWNVTFTETTNHIT